MKRRERIFAWFAHVAVLAMSSLILFFSSRNATDSSGYSQGFLAWLQSLGLTFLNDHIVRKAAHFSEFFVLGVLLYIAYDYNRRVGGPKFLRPFYPLYGLLMPLTDETSQYLSPGRSPQISDVWLDFCGVSCGAVVLFLILYLCRRKRRHCHVEG